MVKAVLGKIFIQQKINVFLGQKRAVRLMPKGVHKIVKGGKVLLGKRGQSHTAHLKNAFYPLHSATH
jgi:hypothetical protein